MFNLYRTARRIVKKGWKGHLIIVALLTIIKILNAQPTSLPDKDIIFDQLPLELGLSQNSINCILQDRDGFLWIGTWSGLIRYDGYSSIVYHSDIKADKLKSDKITAIHEDQKGNLWIGTQMAGLFRFDKNTQKFLQYNHNPSDSSSLSDNNVWCIREDENGNLWVGTENGLNVFDSTNKRFKAFYHDPLDSTSLTNSHVTDLYLSRDNEFWIATISGLNLLSSSADRGYAFKNYRYTDSSTNPEAQNYIFKMQEMNLHGKPSIWLCTGRGLIKFQGGKFQNFQVEGMPSSYSKILSIAVVEGPHPYIIAGSEKGLNFFDPVSNKYTRFLSASDQRVNLSHTGVSALYLDQGGVLWVGTKKGLNKFDSYSKNFVAYQTSTFDKSRSIITGIQGSVDEYWVSTLGAGLYKFHDKIFLPAKINDRSENDLVNFIQTLYICRNGNIWLGTAGEGLYRFDEKDFNTSTGLINRFDHYNARSTPSLSSNYIMAITEDNLGNVWVGTWHGGVNKITPEGNVKIFKDPLLINVPIVVIYVDRTGTIWTGTRGNGLYKIKQKGDRLDIRRLHSTDKSNGNLTNNFINSICEDHNGLLWIGTEGGLHSFDPRSEIFKLLKLKDDSGTNVITSIQEDNNGKLWLAHPDGVTVIDPEDTTYIKQYDYHDHIQGGFFYNNVSFKDESGRLIFGGSEGFNIIEPDVVVQNPNLPRVAISDFQIFGKSVHYGRETEGRIILHEPLNETKQLSLKSAENSISFEFTALDYAAPEKIRYAYMLKGFDADWNYTKFNRRYAIYTNLSEGTYTFKVKATNSDGIWSDQVSELKIVIDPPWWKTGWAIMLYAVATLLALYLFRKLILMRANFRHDLRFERFQRENMEKLNQAKLKFFTNISHEFKTPLTLIMGPVQNLLDRKVKDNEEREQLSSINKNAGRLLRLINQLLDFRKAESGNLKLEVSEGNMVKFLREIKLSFNALAQNLKIDFSFSSSSHIIKAWFDPDQFEKIMFNLLSNAFKNTPEGGKIALRLKEGKDDIIIEVEDNGNGIKSEHFENIFQTFFSYDEDKHHTGTGIGLAFSKSLVDMHHGQLEFESEEHVFTRFVIRLPRGSSHFDASELSPIPNDIESMDFYPSLLSDSSYLEDERATTEVSMDNLPKLLIVEDNDEVRAYIKSIFKNIYSILEAVNGKDGMALAIEEIPNLIISDVMMPVMDGIKFCSQLKSNLKTSHIPVILLSARSSLMFKVEGLETGADDYITKPFNPNVLKLKARNLIHSREVMQKVFQDHGVLDIEPKKVTITPTDEIFVKQALDGIERNMSNPNYNVDDLGKDVGMSRTQLYRKLKALTGQSANEFIRTLRLKRAAQLLELNQLTIAEITHQVGFTDLQYFRDCFKKLFGVIPSEYKNHFLIEPKKK